MQKSSVAALINMLGISNEEAFDILLDSVCKSKNVDKETLVTVFNNLNNNTKSRGKTLSPKIISIVNNLTDMLSSRKIEFSKNYNRMPTSHLKRVLGIKNCDTFVAKHVYNTIKHYVINAFPPEEAEEIITTVHNSSAFRMRLVDAAVSSGIQNCNSYHTKL